MAWSTEENGTFNVFIEFVATNETMYWFWETTDIVDNQLMTYKFNNFNLQAIEKPVPRIEFENTTVKFATAPFISITTNGTTTWGTRWPDFVDSSGNMKTPSAKNYFHTELYDFDYMRYRLWGYSGHEVMTIPISGLTKGKVYTITWTQDLTNAQVYNQYPFGCAVNANSTMDAKVTGTNATAAQSNYMETGKKTYGNISTHSYTFTATTSTMYWHWTLGELKDGMSILSYNFVELSNVSIAQN